MTRSRQLTPVDATKANEHFVPITVIWALILFALLKKADVSKSSSKGKNGQLGDEVIYSPIIFSKRKYAYLIRRIDGQQRARKRTFQP
jgi:hypothetical protein